jgi:hypothetical protein
MNCREAQRHLPGYVDGAARQREHGRIRRHLEKCGQCRVELDRYYQLSQLLGMTEAVAAPAELAMRIRAAASRERTRRNFFQRMRARLATVFEDVLEPLAVPATGGLLSAVLTFALVAQNLFMGLPIGAVANDLPINITQPARLESLAPFPAPGLTSENSKASEGVLVLEATLDARGDVVNYNILAGLDTPQTRRELDQVLLFSHFQPQMSFGRPTAGGRVILSFSEVRVRG